MNTKEIVICLDSKSSQLISSLKDNQQNKSYFANLNIPATDIIEMITKDYLEHLKISLETESYKSFEDKMKWFKSMSSTRLSGIDIRASLLDFHEDFLMEVSSICCHNSEVKYTLNNFRNIIENIFSQKGGSEY